MLWNKKRSSNRTVTRRLQLENLESRSLMAGLPDFYAAKFSAPTSADVGQFIKFPLTVSSIGYSAGTGPVAIHVTLNHVDSGTSVLLFQKTIDNFTQGTSYITTPSVAIPTSLAGGNYTIDLEVDPADEQFEINENNNVLSRPISIIAPPTPDFFAKELTVPSTFYLGKSFQVPFSVANDGMGYGFGSVGLDLVLVNSTSGNSYSLYNKTVTTIAPGSTYSSSAYVTIPSSIPTGDYDVMLRVDPQDVHAEEIESDNVLVRSVKVAVYEVPNYFAYQLDVATTLLTGQTLSIPYAVSNNGTAAATGPVDVDLVLVNSSTGASSSLYSKSLTGFPSGTTHTSSAQVTIPSTLSAGDYQLMLRVDPQGTQAESNEGDNTLSKSVTITIPPPPDFAAKELTVPSTFYLGKSFQVPFSVANLGSGYGQAPVDLDIVLVNQISGSSYSLYTKTVTTIAPGATHSSSAYVTISSSIPTGDYNVMLRVDPQNVHAEAIESDNVLVRSVKVAVYEVPNYFAYQLDVPTTLLTGQTLSIPYAVSNNGTAAATGPVDVDLVLVNSSTGVSSSLYSKSLTSFPSGTTHTSTAQVTIPSTLSAGDYQLMLRVDPQGTQAESNEGDNTLSKSVRVNSVDPLMVSSFGVGGKVFSGLPGVPADSSTKLVATAVQFDGKIVGLATSDSQSTRDMLVVRFNSNGGLDSAFGMGGVQRIASVSNSGYNSSVLEVASSVCIAADGKIIVGGTLNGDFFVARLDSWGRLDQGFGNQGRVTVAFDLGGDHLDRLSALTLQADGKIVLGGTSSISSTGDKDFAVARLLTNGQLDRNFSGDGKHVIAFDQGGDKSDVLTSLAVDASGNMVLAGHAAMDFAGDRNIAVARLTSKGVPDRKFGTAGKTIISFDLGGNKDDGATSLAIQRDGKIVVGGYAQVSSDGNYDFAVVRLLKVGKLDRTFGPGGGSKISFNQAGQGEDRASTVAIDRMGRILLGGTAQVGADIYDLAIVRLTNSGALDTTFNRTGRYQFSFNGGVRRNELSAGLTLDRNRLVVSGSARRNDAATDYAIAQLWNY